jgi:16S rRNA (guanine966-N2)-methyltransferase
VVGARVLDLYAGTGAMGIEALSRGAEHATFVDASAKAVATIRENLDTTGLSDRATVVRAEVLEHVGGLTEPPALVLADPPYDTPPEGVDDLLRGLAKALTEPGARVVLTRPHKGYMPVIPVKWQVARELRYGDTLVVIMLT